MAHFREFWVHQSDRDVIVAPIQPVKAIGHGTGGYHKRSIRSIPPMTKKLDFNCRTSAAHLAALALILGSGLPGMGSRRKRPRL